MGKHTFPSSDPVVSVTVSDAGLFLDHPAAHPVDFRVVEELSREILRLVDSIDTAIDQLQTRDVAPGVVLFLRRLRGKRLAGENSALKERLDATEDRLADAVQPGEIMTALDLGSEIDRLDAEETLATMGQRDGEHLARIAALEARVVELSLDVARYELKICPALEAEVERLRGKSASVVEALDKATEAYPFASALLRAAADMIREHHPQPPAPE